MLQVEERPQTVLLTDYDETGDARYIAVLSGVVVYSFSAPGFRAAISHARTVLGRNYDYVALVVHHSGPES